METELDAPVGSVLLPCAANHDATDALFNNKGKKRRGNYVAASHDDTAEASSHKKKKRRTETTMAEHLPVDRVGSEQSEGSQTIEALEKKRKRQERKERKLAEKAARAQAEADGTITPQSPALPSAVDKSESAVNTAGKKEKKKKSKRGESAVEQPVIPASPIDSNAYTTAPALLSALFSATHEGPLDNDVQQRLLHLATSYDDPLSLAGPGRADAYADPLQLAAELGSRSNEFVLQDHESGGAPNVTLSNEELASMLEAIQNLDTNRVAGVLRTLGVAASYGPPIANASLSPPVPSVLIANPIPGARPGQAIPIAIPSNHMARRRINAMPASSSTILNQDKISQPFGNIQPMEPVTHGHTTAEHHIKILSEKWLSTSQLQELVRNEGLVYKKGKFSKVEDQQLEQAIATYCATNGKTQEDIARAIESGKTRDDGKLWSHLASAVPGRPVMAVWHHVKRIWHPMNNMGSWQPDEDARLKQAVLELGPRWERVSERVGRRSTDCRDRYRNHLAEEGRNTGHWSKEEEEELIRVVSEIKQAAGNGEGDGDLFWGAVSKKMGGKRGRQQCRIKWFDSLEKKVKSGGKIPRWTSHDSYVLVHKVDSLNALHDTEIDWTTFPDATWNLWSPHVIQLKWSTLKKSVKGWENMSLPEILDILRIKHGDLPPPSKTKSTLQRRVTSSMVICPDMESDDEGTSSSLSPVDPDLQQAMKNTTVADKPIQEKQKKKKNRKDKEKQATQQGGDE